MSASEVPRMIEVTRQGRAVLLGLIVVAALLVAAALQTSVSSRPEDRLETDVTISILGYSFAGTTLKVEFRVNGDFLRFGADHVHVYVDGNLATWHLGITGSGYGIYAVDNLEPGQHTIEIVLARANHAELPGAKAVLTVSVVG